MTVTPAAGAGGQQQQQQHSGSTRRAPVPTPRVNMTVMPGHGIGGARGPLDQLQEPSVRRAGGGGSGTPVSPRRAGGANGVGAPVAAAADSGMPPLIANPVAGAAYESTTALWQKALKNQSRDLLVQQLRHFRAQTLALRVELQQRGLTEPQIEELLLASATGPGLVSPTSSPSGAAVGTNSPSSYPVGANCNPPFGAQSAMNTTASNATGGTGGSSAGPLSASRYGPTPPAPLMLPESASASASNSQLQSQLPVAPSAPATAATAASAAPAPRPLSPVSTLPLVPIGQGFLHTQSHDVSLAAASSSMASPVAAHSPPNQLRGIAAAGPGPTNSDSDAPSARASMRASTGTPPPPPPPRPGI